MLITFVSGKMISIPEEEAQGEGGDATAESI